MAFNIGRTGQEEDALMRWPPRSPDLTPYDFSYGGLWRTLSLCLHSLLISRIFATVSPLLWLLSTVICWHACGTRWTIAYMSAILPKVDTLSIC